MCSTTTAASAKTSTRGSSAHLQQAVRTPPPWAAAAVARRPRPCCPLRAGARSPPDIDVTAPRWRALRRARGGVESARRGACDHCCTSSASTPRRRGEDALVHRWLDGLRRRLACIERVFACRSTARHERHAAPPRTASSTRPSAGSGTPARCCETGRPRRLLADSLSGADCADPRRPGALQHRRPAGGSCATRRSGRCSLPWPAWSRLCVVTTARSWPTSRPERVQCARSRRSNPRRRRVALRLA